MDTRMFVIYNYGDENHNPVLGRAISLAQFSMNFIFDRLTRFNFGNRGRFVFENDFGIIRINPHAEEYPKQADLINSVKSSIGSGELAIVQVESRTVEKFNASDMNVLEKVVFRLFFPDVLASEDKLIFAQNVVKQFNLTEDAIEKLVKKSIFRDKDINSYSFSLIRRSAFEKAVLEAFDKYVKNHKSDVKVKSGVAVITDANEIIPFVLTNYLVKKSIRLIIGKVGHEDHYAFFNQFPFISYDEDEDDDEDVEDEDFYKSIADENLHIAILIAVACLQEGIGNFNEEDRFYITGDEIENACKVAKKVFDGKYVFKFNNKGGVELVIKDRPDFHIYWNYNDAPRFSVLKEDDLIEKVSETDETSEE